ncbi:unnamed protein product [marine sediment metagenome]|uniref:Uncharacterized protein n=1 Tax=marine sediment metagenome TaxID=412755 RepID=X1E1M9_9ZZZZ
MQDDPLLEIPYQPAAPDPTPEEIRQRAAEIQATWPPKIELLRRGLDSPPIWEFPRYRTEYRRDGVSIFPEDCAGARVGD